MQIFCLTKTLEKHLKSYKAKKLITQSWSYRTGLINTTKHFTST